MGVGLLKRESQEEKKRRRESVTAQLEGAKQKLKETLAQLELVVDELKDGDLD
jgi:hypothetical protein